MNCLVDGCRFSDKHNTGGNVSGKCKKFGHGQREC